MCSGKNLVKHNGELVVMHHECRPSHKLEACSCFCLTKLPVKKSNWSGSIWSSRLVTAKLQIPLKFAVTFLDWYLTLDLLLWSWNNNKKKGSLKKNGLKFFYSGLDIGDALHSVIRQGFLQCLQFV